MSTQNRRHCCVPTCSNNAANNEKKISFHRFPKEKVLKKKWIIAIRRDVGNHFKLTDSTCVCSDHFIESDFKWTPGNKTLKHGTVPAGELNLRKKENLQRPFQDFSDSREESEDDGQLTDSSTTDSAPETMYEAKIQKLESEVVQLKQTVSALQVEKFGLNRFAYDDEQIHFFTGFETYQLYMAFYHFIQPTASNMQSVYYQPSAEINRKGHPRTMLLIDELFMVLNRLRLNLLEKDLEVRFKISTSTVSRIFISWINYLYFVLGRIPIWLERDVIDRLMPQCFKDSYPSTRVIIDCTEIYTQQPSSLVTNSQLYSNYKSHTTFKGLVGIAPHGAITFISQLYTGNMADIEISRTSGFLTLLEAGDSVIADKGFVLKKDLEKIQVALNIPPFLQENRQFSEEEIKVTETVARLRIHVERIMRRIKENRIFSTNLPMSLVGSVNQMWAVACLLVNFRKPIVSGWG